MFQFSHSACWLMGSSPITSMVCGQGEHGRRDNCYSCVVDVVISPGEVWSRSCHHHHHHHQCPPRYGPADDHTMCACCLVMMRGFAKPTYTCSLWTKAQDSANKMGNYLTTMKIKYFTQYLKYFKRNLQCGLEMYYYLVAMGNYFV